MTDLREVLDQALDEQSEEIKKLVEQAFQQEKRREIWVTITCKGCGRMAKYPTVVDLPDYRERVRALDTLMTQAKGKPKETVKQEVTINLKPIHHMTMAELEEEEQRILEAHPELGQ